jgi:hypothetical protein
VEQGKTSQSRKVKYDRACVNECLTQSQRRAEGIELHCKIKGGWVVQGQVGAYRGVGASLSVVAD